MTYWNQAQVLSNECINQRPAENSVIRHCRQARLGPYADCPWFRLSLLIQLAQGFKHHHPYGHREVEASHPTRKQVA